MCLKLKAQHKAQAMHEMDTTPLMLIRKWKLVTSYY